MAPAGAGSTAAPDVNLPPPTAVLSQEEEPTPTTPEGEQQETIPEEEVLVPGVEEETPAEPPTESEEATGFLPVTGFAIVALSALGLCLLAAGLALRPTPRP